MPGVFASLMGSPTKPSLFESLMPSSGGFGSNLRSLLDPEIALPMAGAMIAGQTPGESFGNAFMLAGKGIGERRKRNKTIEFLKKNRPDLLAAVEAGAPMSEVWNAAMGKQTTYGTSPSLFTDKDGNLVYGAFGNDGSFKKIDTGGLTPEKNTYRDLGTHIGVFDGGGNLVTMQPKDLRGAEREKEIGTGQGKAAVAAPADLQQAANALDLVSDLRNDPNRPTGTGWSAAGNVIPGTPGFDYQQKVNQAKSGAFLSAIQQLRGMGALSNAEGATATAAVTRMTTAASEREFMAALDAYEAIVRQAYDRAASTAQQFDTMPPGGMPAPTGGGGVVDYTDYFKGP